MVSNAHRRICFIVLVWNPVFVLILYYLSSAGHRLPLQPIIMVVAVATAFFALLFLLLSRSRKMRLRQFVQRGKRTTARVVDAGRFRSGYMPLGAKHPFYLDLHYKVSGAGYGFTCVIEGDHTHLRGKDVDIAYDPQKPSKCWPLLHDGSGQQESRHVRK